MRNNSKAARVVIYIGLVLWMLVNLFPVYWMFTFSLKSNPEIFGENVIGLPKEWLWSNYSSALKTGNMARYFLNSTIVAVATILITLGVALMATFALTRLIWKRRKTLNKFFMLGLTIPIHASIVPVYVTLSRLHMLNTYWALIIPYSAFSLSMAILVCTGFMNEIPRDLDESACIDGCSVWGIFFKIICPTSNAPGRRPGPFRAVYHRMGSHRRRVGAGYLPDPVHLHLPEQEDPGELHRRRHQRISPALLS